MIRTCNICGTEFESMNDANQCSPECRRTHAARFVDEDKEVNVINIKDIGTLGGMWKPRNRNNYTKM